MQNTSTQREFYLKPLTVACLMAVSVSAHAETTHLDTSNNHANSNQSSKNLYSRWQSPNQDTVNRSRPPIYSRWLLPAPSDNANTGGTNTGTGNTNTGGTNTGTNTGIINNTGNTNTVAPYVAPIKSQNLNKPDYTRQVNQALVRAQSRGSANTRTGYSAMDSANDTNLTQKFYGTSEDGYAERLNTLKTTIDTRNEKIGVIDTGINRNNQDMIGANVHSTQIRCNIAGRNNCYLPSDDSGIVEIPTTFASGDHGNQMAAIVAGNNGMTNARIYGSDSIDRASNGGNQFLMMRKLNQDHGVKIFNNSWGSNNTDRWYRDAINSNYNRDTGEVTYSRYGSVTNADITLPVIHDLVLNRDALIVKATGNEGQNDAHDENLAPLINDKFKKGFITVSSPREDFDSANYCGRTAEWCVSATSTTQNYANNGRLSTYQGTSPATARVAGTAVLVKAAYPWMKNENIAQTIFSTAKDFADIAAQSPTYQGLIKLSRLPSGYRGNYYTDSRGNFYIPGEQGWQNRQVIANHNGKNLTWEGGWGLLDPETAAKGYGGFYWDDVVLDTAGTPTSVFYNNLKGEKGFTKTGDGKLVLVGDNSYRGDSIIKGGSLEVNGNNGVSHMKVEGGELTGYGKVAKVTQTDGWVNNEGNLHIDGDYTANIAKDKDAGLKVQFGNLLSVSGKAKLGGVLNLTGEAKNGIITQTGSRSTVLRADRGVEGGFDNSRSSNPLFEVTKVEYTPTADSNGNTASHGTNTDVQVTAKRLSAGNVVYSISMNDSGHTVANNLDKVLNELDNKQETGKLDDSEIDFAKNVFASFENMATTTNTLSTPSTNRELYRLDPTVYANTASNALDESANQTVQFSKQLGNAEGRAIWGNVDFQERDYKLNHATSDRKTTNYSVGVATKLNSGVGLGMQIDAGKLDLTDAVYGVNNKTETDMIGLTVGAGKNIGNAHVSGWVKGANVKTESERHGTNTKGDFDGRLYGVGMQVGTTIQPTPTSSIKPYVFASHQNYKYDGSYNDGINTINSIKADQTQAGVGVDIAYRPSNNWEIFGGAQVAQNLNKDVKLNTNYTGTSTAVEFDEWETGKTKVSGKVGVNYNITPNSQVGISYDYTDGKYDDANHINVGFTSRF
ncbi:S8 family serine peptidase [Moraxella oblonga]|uniref:S8 family serine peptidase n=1 Tax=Moraxella oblonga TaxID=200413 RepID=UPI00082D8897|nr:S8 family serine peptidase [Moraxella oblonga]